MLFITIFISGYSFLYAYYSRLTKCTVVAGNQNILIFSPHPDDGAIMAAGYAMQTKKNEGEVKIAYLTGNDQRMQEAYSAWELIGLTKNDLVRLEIDRDDRLFNKDINEKVSYLKKIIEDTRPQIIFVPLYEGGHFEHDFTNYLVSRAVDSIEREIVVYECPEYNFYFSLTNTPEKFLDVFSRLIPFFEFHAPPSFINLGKAQFLCMTEEEIELKKRMLAKFMTQHPDHLVMYFGFNDRFQPYQYHDYYVPPHDYGNAIVNGGMRSESIVVRKIFNKLFVRPFWKINTIYSEEERHPVSSLLSK
jgi:LmbE family N-acetylglucosaminyl deacetylase